MGDEQGALVPIGRFSAICRLTIKALRHYDELGLLRPAFVDPRSGYRYYRLDQVATADLIRTLRAAEMPLDEIGTIVGSPAAAEAQIVIARQRQRLRDHIAAQQAAITTLDQLLAPNSSPMVYAIEVLTIPAQTIISERLTARLDDVGLAIGRAITATRAFITRHDAQPSGAPIALYHTGMEEESLAIEVGWPIAAPLPGEGAIGLGTIGGVTVARTLHRGPHERIGGAFAALAGWIQRHGHETAGAPWETYLTEPSDAADPSQLLTTVSWPIR